VVWVLALSTLAAVTMGLLALRGHVDKSHIALVYLLVVLAGSAAGGRALGLTLAALAFLAFNYVFLPPYYTLAIQNPVDWLVLAVFLVTSIVAAELLDRAQVRADEARQRAAEVERLAMLGSETLNAGRAEDALVAIAGVIRATIGVACCEILLERGTPPEYVPAARAGDCGASATLDAASLAAWVAHEGVPAEEHDDRTVRILARQPSDAMAWGQRGPWRQAAGARVMLVPLRVRDRTVGVMRIAHTSPIELDPAQQQFLDALAYYAALGAERVRLAAEAERAEALRQAGDLKNALLAAVSHDLRTPLTTIKSIAHGIVEGGARAGDGRAESIEEEVDRLNRVVGDLLELSRLTGGAIRFQPELNTAEDVVGAAVRRVSGVRHGRELRVVRDARAPILIGRFDFVHALRALGNLVENALKYSPPGTAVELSVRREGPMLVFTVADRGAGVPEGERERIFESFYRPARTPPDVGGSGLGLAIARGLAEGQGGSVRYQPRPGGGSLFELFLPAADEPAL